MKTLSLNPIERSTIMTAFQSPLQSPNGGQRGADVTELRKAMRIFDKLKFDDFLKGPADDTDTDEVKYEIDDADLTYLERVFRDANIWGRNPTIAKRVIAVSDKIEAASKEA